MLYKNVEASYLTHGDLNLTQTMTARYRRALAVQVYRAPACGGLNITNTHPTQLGAGL